MLYSMNSAVVRKASAGLSGFDVNQPLTASDASSFKDAGYSFCIRYVPRTASLVANNLTDTEALEILNAGLSLMAVQHVPLPGWAPSTNLGTQYGNYAAAYAQQVVQLPTGMNIWCDLEGVATATDPQDVIDYCQAWYAAVDAAGYIPGLYVGYGTALTPTQLHDELSFQHYWKAYNGPEVETRGYQLLQSEEKTLNGITFDPNITQNDLLGDSVLWLSF